ncbi:Putative aminotransferase class V domain, pyridoxal phosphate-dependent transferase, major [Septoria linicola]|uniref:Aminotransferase class V domain, pyridoxal phosphate-dependent transferase, major n=1 Tax=Septoria linicola TaxID=215465 RepID=A0A9Q9AWD9_9PEZI|nr:putative aminotransferase class V domain, pyridoxal phosphate-dependent transferase, major [Septoria linicola]USW53323.1 Putative aminotransferase class V domain, pyridoxal phosphate-dependent transferase, major [Septoria linicola]
MSILQNIKDLTLGSGPTDHATADPNNIDKIEVGEEAAKHFLFQGDYRNLNHGSFGTYPRAVRTSLRALQDECEGQPDRFIRYTYPRKLDESREAVAKYLNVPTETVVFVPNATTGVNTVLRNLVWQPGDVIIYFSTIYGACHKTIDYLTETTPVQSKGIEFTYPISDADLNQTFSDTIASIKAAGQTPKLAIFDSIVSMPGVLVPFQQLTQICRSNNILSLIDGAHSIGQIPMDLATLDPDFYISNLHKWLHVPRGCAVFYCPVRNQPLMRSSLPTSHGFVPAKSGGPVSPLPPSSKSEFVNQFEFTGTIDTNPYLCVGDALKWRSKIAWKDLKGEEAIMAYYNHLARQAGSIVSEGLGGTEIMENEGRTLGQCAFANVQLPLSFDSDASGSYPTAVAIAQWMSRVLVEEYNTFLAILIHGGKWWVRLSAQVYLTEQDFEWGGKVLKEVCERAKKGEWKSEGGQVGKLPVRLAGNQISATGGEVEKGE